MLIYFAPPVLAVLSIVLRNRALEQFAILFAGVALLIRDGVGYDYENYARIFELDISFTFAPFADLLQDTARILMVPNGFMGITAIISTALMLYMSRSGATPRMSIFVFFALPFFFLESFSIVRQILAVLFAALSYQMLRQNRNVGSVITFLIAVGIHVSAAISLPLFMLVNPNLNWRYLLLFPPAVGIAYAASSVFLGSNLLQYYASLSISGDYYLIVTAASLVVALFFKDRELIMCAIFGFIVAIMITLFGNYTFNRMLVFFYIPFLFAPIRVRGLKMPVYSFVAAVMIGILFASAFQVKLREPNNRFIPYETIF
jgi:hypothetical protein